MITILVADDDDLMLEFLCRKLEGQLFHVLAARDGHRALELVRTNNPDIIVLDVMMPGLDGFSVLRALKSNPETADIPVMMLTRRKSEEDIAEGLDQGVADYLSKPFMPADFIMRVEKILDDQGKSEGIAWS